MVKVYRLKSDYSCQYFFTENKSDESKLTTNGTPRSSSWVPPGVFIYEPLLAIGDLYNFHSDSPIFSPRATEALRFYLEMAGELLDLPYNGEIYTLLNVTVCINCLNQKETEWGLVTPEGVHLHPKKYVFHPDRFSESLIFKIPETRGSEVLVLDREDGEGFVDALIENQIKGYNLELLWSYKME